MLRGNVTAGLTIALIAGVVQPVSAQTVAWTVVAAEDGRVISAGLPEGTSRSITDIALGDTGGNRVGFRVTSPASLSGYWAQTSTGLRRYTQLAVTGDLGPGRSGAESTHVFLNVYGGDGETAADGTRLFRGRASDPASTTNASYGVWRWNQTSNVEIARSLTSGVLGPGLPDGSTFANTSTFVTDRGLRNGGALLEGTVTSQSGATSHLMTRHVPGQGNQPCLRSGSTDRSLAPGLVDGDSFSSSWLNSNLSVSANDRMYGVFNASGSRTGIWEICSGPPSAKAVNAATGLLGPDVGIATAAFTTDIQAAYPGLPGQFYFFASYRESASSSADQGLFWNDGLSNRALAINDATGAHGPQWNGSTWRTFNVGSLSSSGADTAFTASVTTADGGNPTGLWHVRAGGAPQLRALLGIEGAYGPEPHRTWRSFGAIAALPNGDVLVEATTDPDIEQALWLLEGTRAPRRVLTVGQSVLVPTASGAVAATITSFDLPNGGAEFSRGNDSWVGADGTAVVVANVSTYGKVILKAAPSDRIFQDSFD